MRINLHTLSKVINLSTWNLFDLQSNASMSNTHPLVRSLFICTFFILYFTMCMRGQKWLFLHLNSGITLMDLFSREDLSKIPYTTMCIKESLRLYPPVPGMSRKITKPMTFFDGRTVPEGTVFFFKLKFPLILLYTTWTRTQGMVFLTHKIITLRFTIGHILTFALVKASLNINWYLFKRHCLSL